MIILILMLLKNNDDINNYSIDTNISKTNNNDIDNGYITYHVRYVYHQDDDGTPVHLGSP
jgi:hypothetical protein